MVPQCHLMAEETRRRGYGKKIPQVRCFSGGKKRTGGASGRHADDCDSHEKQRPTGETPASRHRYPTRGFLSSALETIATAPEVLPRRTKATDCWARDGMGWDWWAVLTCALPPCEVRASLRARGRWKFPRGTCCKLSVERRDLRGPGRMPTDMPRHQRTLGRSSRPLLAFPSLITSSPCPGRPAPPPVPPVPAVHSHLPAGSPRCGPPQPSSPSARPPWTVLPRVIISPASACSPAASRAPSPSSLAVPQSGPHPCLCLRT